MVPPLTLCNLDGFYSNVWRKTPPQKHYFENKFHSSHEKSFEDMKYKQLNIYG